MFLKYKDGGKIHKHLENNFDYLQKNKKRFQIPVWQQQMLEDNATGGLQKKNTKVKWHKTV